jgi:hypothetical protein
MFISVLVDKTVEAAEHPILRAMIITNANG